MVGAGAVAPVAAGGRTANNGVRKVAPEQNLRPVAHCAIAAEVDGDASWRFGTTCPHSPFPGASHSYIVRRPASSLNPQGIPHPQLMFLLLLLHGTYGHGSNKRPESERHGSISSW